MVTHDANIIDVKRTTLALRGVLIFLDVNKSDIEWRLGDIRLPPWRVGNNPLLLQTGY